jgi:hypothetical protein
LNPFLNTVYIQAQDNSGVWRTYNVTIRDDIVIINNMQALKKQFPNFRIRAVDSMGNMLNFLP